MRSVITLQQQQKEYSTVATDEVLLSAVAVGAGDALGELFVRHHLKVYRFLTRMAPLDRHHIDDLVQNTFMAASESARRFRGNASVETWLMAIAANILKQHIHKEARRRSLTGILQKNAPQSVCDTTPESEVMQHKMMDQLAQGIQQMSHKLKVVFVMCDLEGIAGTEVARILNLREGTVWSRLHDARKQLREVLAAHREGDQ